MTAFENASWKHCEKQEMLVTSISFLSHNIFSSFKDKFDLLGQNEIVVCKRRHFGQNQFLFVVC